MRERPMKRFAAAAVLALLASCADDQLTQVMVVVDTDFEVPEGIDELEITVTGPGGRTFSFEDAIDPAQLPMRLAVVHRGGPLGTYRVRVQGQNRRLTPPEVVERRADFTFVRGEVRELRMDLLRECVDVLCEQSETCGPGGCRSVVVPPSELPLYTGPTRFDGGMPDQGAPSDMDEGCVPEEEICNGVDDNCNGEVDELTDLDNDMRHCGRCDRACETDPQQGSEICVDGDCVLTCDDGFGDCDDAVPGCEADLTSAATCGSCERRCEGATPVCDVDTCISDCLEGTTDCSGTCADLDTSVSHCGSCGRSCPGAINALPLCAAGGCSLRCDSGFFDCDGSIATNGCESRLTELDNCGACGASCRAAQASTSCATGTCEVVACLGTTGDCDGDVMTGCETDVSTSLFHCGQCGRSCPFDPPNGSPMCVMGNCQVACDPGFANCNGVLADGCEAYLGSTASCGSCGIRCDGATPSCSGSPGDFRCVASCSPGQTACGANGENCVDTANDSRRCGSCTNVCPDPPRASPICQAGRCGFTCDAGFEDCDANPSNGCEASLAATSSCGSCDNPCPAVPNAALACNGNECSISGCQGMARDCDGLYGNGCEVDVATNASHCGACGRTCVPGSHVVAVGCAALGCVIQTCEAGWGDCDGDFTTGCEANLTSRKNCGECGNDCGGGREGRCCDGMCGC